MNVGLPFSHCSLHIREPPSGSPQKRMKKNVTCYDVHVWKPHVLLGYDNGVLEEVALSDTPSLPRVGDHHLRPICSLYAGWRTDGVHTVRYLPPHESVAFPLQPPQSTRTSYVPPSPLLRDDLALAFSAHCCSLIDLGLGTVCCRWLMPFSPSCLAFSGPIVAMGPHSWGTGFHSHVNGSSQTDWNPRHCMLLDVSCYRIGATEIVEGSSKQKVDMLKHILQHGRSMEASAMDQLIGASCASTTSTSDKTLQTLIQAEGHPSMPFVASVYTSLSWGALLNKIPSSSMSNVSQRTLDWDVSQTLQIEVSRVVPEGRTVPCGAPVRITELLTLLAPSRASFIATRLVSDGNHSDSPLRLVVALSCGVALLSLTETLNSGNGTLAASTISVSSELGASVRKGSSTRLKQLPQWTPLQIYCLASSQNPITALSRAHLGDSLEVVHRNGCVVALALNENKGRGSAKLSASSRVVMLRLKPLSASSMWRVPCAIVNAPSTSSGSLQTSAPAVMFASSTQRNMIGYHPFLNCITVSPLSYPKSSATVISPCCEVVVSAAANANVFTTFRHLVVAVNAQAKHGGAALPVHELRFQLCQPTTSHATPQFFTVEVPQMGDVAEMDVRVVRALVVSLDNRAVLVTTVLVNLYEHGPGLHQDICGAQRPEAAVIITTLPLELANFDKPTRVTRLCSATTRVLRAKQLEGALAMSVALCPMSSLVWVLCDTASRHMVVRSFQPQGGHTAAWEAEYKVDPTVSDITVPTQHARHYDRALPEALIALIHRKLGAIDVISASTGARRLHYSIPRKAHCDDSIFGEVMCLQFQESHSGPTASAALHITTTHASSVTKLRSDAANHGDLRVHCAIAVYNPQDDTWSAERAGKDVMLYPWPTTTIHAFGHGLPSKQHHVTPRIIWRPSSDLFVVTAATDVPNHLSWLVETTNGLASPVALDLGKSASHEVTCLGISWRASAAARDDFEQSHLTTVATHSAIHCTQNASRCIAVVSQRSNSCLTCLRVILPQFRLQAALVRVLHPTPLAAYGIHSGQEEPDVVTAAQLLLAECHGQLESSFYYLVAASTLSTFGLCVRWLLNECRLSLEAARSSAQSSGALWWSQAWARGARGILFQLLRAASVGEHDAETTAMVSMFLDDNNHDQPSTLSSVSLNVLAEWLCCVSMKWWDASIRHSVEEWLTRVSIVVKSDTEVSREVFRAIDVTPLLGEVFIASTFAPRDLYGVASITLRRNVSALLPFLCDATSIAASPPADALQRYRRVMDGLVTPQHAPRASEHNSVGLQDNTFERNAFNDGDGSQKLMELLAGGYQWAWDAPKRSAEIVEYVDGSDTNVSLASMAHQTHQTSTAFTPLAPPEDQQAKLRRQFQQGHAGISGSDDSDDSDPDFVDTGRYGMIDLRGAIVLKGKTAPSHSHVATTAVVEERSHVSPTPLVSDSTPVMKLYPAKTAKSDRVGVQVSSSFEPLFESLEANPVPTAHAMTIPTQALAARLGSAGGQRPQSSRRVAITPPTPPAPTLADNLNAVPTDIASAAPAPARHSVQAHLTSKAADEMIESAMNAMDVQNFGSALKLFKSVELSTGGATADAKALCRAYRKVCTALCAATPPSQGDQLSPMRVVDERGAALLAAALVVTAPSVRPFHLLMVSLPLLEYCVNRNTMWQAAQAAANFVTYLINNSCQDDAWRHMYVLWSHEHENQLGILTSMCQAVEDYCSLLGGDPPADEQPQIVNILMGDITDTDYLFQFNDL